MSASGQRSNRNDRPEVGTVEHHVKADAVHGGFQRTSSRGPLCIPSIRVFISFVVSSLPFLIPSFRRTRMKAEAVRNAAESSPPPSGSSLRSDGRRMRTNSDGATAGNVSDAGNRLLPENLASIRHARSSELDCYSWIRRLQYPTIPQKSCAFALGKAEKCNFQRFEPLGKVDYRASRT